jgi:hypothetical protein
LRGNELWVTLEVERELEHRQCVKTKVMPEDVARMALWLAALDSRMCTGQSFVVDGARSSATRACTMAVDDDSFLIAQRVSIAR